MDILVSSRVSLSRDILILAASFTNKGEYDQFADAQDSIAFLGVWSPEHIIEKGRPFQEKYLRSHT
jgi:hypothetical protein